MGSRSPGPQHRFGSAANAADGHGQIGFLYLRGGEVEGRQILERAWIEKSLSQHGTMRAKNDPVAHGFYWWLYPERHVAEAWGGAGQRIALLRDLNVVVVMTANDPSDYPRAPLAARLYDLVRESVTSERKLPANPTGAVDSHTLSELTRQ